MSGLLVTAILSGLSTGIYCFSYCFPFISTLIVSEERKNKDNIFLIVKFLLGRCVGYVIFGAALGYLGERFAGPRLNYVVNFSMLLLSLVMIVNALGIMGEKKFTFCARLRSAKKTAPFLLGLFMGVNICPPFLISMGYVMDRGGLLNGIIYFLLFFVGTSIYFIPLFFLGTLSKFDKLRSSARISAVTVGVIFLVYSIYNLVGGDHFYGHLQH